MRILLFLIFVVMSTFANATECDAELVNQVTDVFEKSSHLRLDNLPGHENDDKLSSCKLLRGETGLAAIAYASFNEAATKKSAMYGGKNYANLREGDGIFDFIVLLVRVKDRRILGRYIGKGELESNAVMLTGVEIDGASFKLSKDGASFGVRVHANAHSQMYAYDQTDLTLFSYSNGNFGKVLDHLPVKSYVGSVESDCKDTTFTDTKRFVIIDNASTNGLRDLVIHTKEKTIYPPCGSDSTKERESKGRDDRITVLFDGKKYDTRKLLRK